MKSVEGDESRRAVATWQETAADREVLEQVQVILELMVKAAVAAEWVKMALLQMVLAVQVL